MDVGMTLKQDVEQCTPDETGHCTVCQYELTPGWKSWHKAGIPHEVKTES